MDHGVVVQFTKEKPVGAKAASTWLAARGLEVAALPWKVLIALHDANNTRFHLAIDNHEWGYCFCRGTGMSWIRITTAAFVHERDDFGLLLQTPTLANVGSLIQRLEDRHQMQLDRPRAMIHTNIAGAEHKIRLWVVAAL